jgi:hypothetical protein
MVHTAGRLFILFTALITGMGQVRDIDGVVRPLFAPAGVANVLIFVSSDCPVSNGYAPEVQRICRAYRAKGVACSLVYEDMSISQARVRAHLDEFDYKDMAAVIDGDRAIAKQARAIVTPQAVVVGPDGGVKYRGRINNQYVALGKPRRVVTQHDLRDALDAVISGKAVAHPETEAVGCFIATGRDQP